MLPGCETDAHNVTFFSAVNENPSFFVSKGHLFLQYAVAEKLLRLKFQKWFAFPTRLVYRSRSFNPFRAG